MTSKSVYVGGLHPSTTQRNFKNFLSKFGKVKSIDLVKEKGTGNSQGFGFATFKEQEAADLAVSKSGQLKLKGNEIRITYTHIDSKYSASHEHTDSRLDHNQQERHKTTHRVARCILI